MTWGQLRFQLQTGAPGISLDLLDEFLNTTYESALEATDWSDLHYHSTIQTQAAYQSTTDSATFTVGDNAVVGVGTSWTSALIGTHIYLPADAVFYTITDVSSTTSLTLDRNYEGTGNDATGTVYASSAYVLMQHVYAIPQDVRSIVSITDPATGLPLQMMSKSQLDACAGMRTLIQAPLIFAPYDDTSESLGLVLKQIEFYPPPQYARGYPIEYIHAANGWDGATTASAPMPFLSSNLLLHGCRAKIAIHLGNGAQAASYQALHDQELRRLLLLEETQRRPKRSLQMDPRYTRHRMARVQRGFRNNWGIGAGGPN